VDSVVGIQARLRDGLPKKRGYISRRGTRWFLLSSVPRPALEPI